MSLKKGDNNKPSHVSSMSTWMARTRTKTAAEAPSYRNRRPAPRRGSSRRIDMNWRSGKEKARLIHRRARKQGNGAVRWSAQAWQKLEHGT
eukprot:6212904-Pleurochrysis_carterae.AAC.2